MLEIDDKEIWSLVGEMAEIERVTRDGVLGGVEETLFGVLFRDGSGVKVVTVTGFGGKRKLGYGIEGEICLRGREREIDVLR